MKEVQGNWVRVSKYYTASCTNGVSDYVDEGNSACNSNNGIRGGNFAEWALGEGMSPQRPADPAKNAVGWSKIISKSDDFRKFEAAFVRAAKNLVATGRCAKSDFREWGGFTKSTNHKGPYYFFYCGGGSISNRFYLNALTGKITR